MSRFLDSKISQNLPVYVRHNVCISDEAQLADIFRQGKIAVHYGDEEDWDKWASLQGALQYRWGKTTVNLFEKLDKEGGWVVADYSRLSPNYRPESRHATILIGRAVAGSKSFLRATRECKDYQHHGPNFRPIHVYKTIQLEKPERFAPDQYHLLNLPFGRAAICETRVLSLENVQRIYGHQSLGDDVWSLAPSELELLCQEYLRVYFTPKLDYLLDNIGGQRKDIDIRGIDSSGMMILAQVSHDFNKKKLAALVSHTDLARRLIYLGPGKHKLEVPEGVTYVPVEKVFDEMKTSNIFIGMIERFLNPQRFGTDN